MIPTNETERLFLFPLNKDSLRLYEEFYTDKNTSKMYINPLVKEKIGSRLKLDLGSWYLLGFGVWIIQRKSDVKLVSICGFYMDGISRKAYVAANF